MFISHPLTYGSWAYVAFKDEHNHDPTVINPSNEQSCERGSRFFLFGLRSTICPSGLDSLLYAGEPLHGVYSWVSHIYYSVSDKLIVRNARKQRSSHDPESLNKHALECC